ncbi:MAG: DNA ligase D [Pigmentiphaga sp.]|uniref:DNA ligase D n=1 Tax=Pigmentiphaga sp. TaxID=1977564 RepID=UPI0029A9C2CB|nr:DNA ligase D [Pigmentiphaga sp.]MDX3905288.1 DNA ligase D [Pigmentiphaga sp.]
MARNDSLSTYRAKRDFSRSPEPSAGGKRGQGALSFVVQRHAARRLHYDFRLELDGTLKSWAVPKGPSLDPGVKRMAVQVEDHPLSYGSFEGRIPEGHYGAGEVAIWDAGTWVPLEDPRKGYRAGKLKFELRGTKLHGQWALVRMRKAEKQPAWLLIKEKDEYAVSGPQADAEEASPPAPAYDKLPPRLEPELATLVNAAPPDHEHWQYELKFDGYRILARIEDGHVRLLTRTGKDWTHKLKDLHEALSTMQLADAWLDGEIIVPDEQGIPDFQALQNAFETGSARGVVYYLFDIPFYAGRDLRGLPLTDRRATLRSLLDDADPAHVRFSDAFDAMPRDLVASACKLGFEGVIGKRKDSGYRSGRSADWIKLKCQNRQEFVIGGYTDPKGSRTGLGSLLLGVYDEHGRLRYAGNVGSGFSQRTLESLKKRLDELATPHSPFEQNVAGAGKAHWVRPELLAEVSFAEWTGGGHVRQGVFRGLRADKPADAVTREEPAAPPKESETMQSNGLPSSFHVTHPGRVIDKQSGITKLQLIQCYAAMAPLLLPHLKDRPVALVRAPEGIGGELFFQKHADRAALPGIVRLPQKLDPGHPPLMKIDDLQGLLSVAQMNTIELHTWNGVDHAIGTPDRMTFDLDPGEGVGWPQIQEGTKLLHVFLQELGLPAFPKTSGGKGMHVIVPLQPEYDWDTVKAFSRAIVRHLATTLPRHFVSKSGPRNRVGKIFIDYLRNGFGATTVCAWSVRARPGLGVSVPVAWDELDSLTSSAHWTLYVLGDRLATGNAPWADYERSRISLSDAMRRMDFDPKTDV